MTIGERIRRRRLELGYTVDDIAEKLKKNRATIYRYESDEIENLPITTLEPLAKILDTTPAYLMGWDEEKPEPETKDDPLMVVAAHHSDYDWSESQLKEIDRFINFVKQEKEKNK